MADTVRYLMEEMIPELEDMVKQQYFNKQEVKQIVKRRQDFEYLLKRKAALKDDFLRYIEYEAKLDALRLHRRQALGLEGKKKKSLADFAIVRRIHFIFERALRKFKTDLSLWTAWLEFCRSSSSNRRLGRVVARALQIHPTEPGLWVYAAAWEFEHNANPAAARALMQQGLRMCRYSDKMWLDYFDLELMYVEKLVARRRILGLDVPEADDDADDDQKQQQQEQPASGDHKRRRVAAAAADNVQVMGGDSAAEAAEDDGEGPESKAEAAVAAAEPTLDQVLSDQQQQAADGTQGSGLQDAQAAVQAVLTGAVARLVFQQAIKAASSSKGVVSSSNYLKPNISYSRGSNSSSSGLEFRANFLRVLSRYTSPGVTKLRREIIDSIRHDFPSDPAAADLLARITCDPADTTASDDAVQAAAQEYERLLGHSAGGVAAAGGDSSKDRSAKRRKKAADVEAAADAVPLVPPEAVPEVYRLYAAFLQERMSALAAQEQHALAAAAVVQQLFRVLLSAHSAGAADEELYTQWVQLATQLQQSKIALKAARLATEAHPTSATAWQSRLDLEAQALHCSTAAAAAATGGAGGDPGEQQLSQQQRDRQQQLFALVTQALQKVPAAAAVQLWQQGLHLAASLATADSSSQLAGLQKLLLSAVTAASSKGPSTGGMGAVAAGCLEATWRVSGAAAARKLWQQLLLLPPAGGDMFRAMIALELQSGADEGASKKQQQRIRAVYEAWSSAYGSSDAGLWVDWAMFEQQQGKAGAGKVYWRAVKALVEPDEFMAQYRQHVGVA